MLKFLWYGCRRKTTSHVSSMESHDCKVGTDTSWLSGIAGPVIPLFFMVFMFLRGDTEAGLISVVLSALALLCHLPSVFGIFKGTTSQTDVLGALAKKFKKKKKSKKIL